MTFLLYFLLIELVKDKKCVNDLYLTYCYYAMQVEDSPRDLAKIKVDKI